MLLQDRVDDSIAGGGLAVLAGFRQAWRSRLGRWGDTVFELADAVLCAPGPVEDLARLSLEPVSTRGHGGVYQAVNNAWVDVDGVRADVAGLPLDRFPDGRIVLAVDASNWLRPDAGTSPERLSCHVHGRSRGQDAIIPGWPYQWVAALEAGQGSWTRLLDVERIGPDTDETELTVLQVRRVVAGLADAGHHREGDPAVMAVMDAGYNLARLAWLLRDDPVQIVGRVRSDRVYRLPAPEPDAVRVGRPARHGDRFELIDEKTWPEPSVALERESASYGHVTVTAFDRVHPLLARASGGWGDHEGNLPLIESTLVRVYPEHLYGDRAPQPLWLWTPRTGLSADDVDSCWMAYLRRFDIEHTFRFLKQHLGWTKPMLRSSDAADRWTWLILACHTMLGLARSATADLRLPWQPKSPQVLTHTVSV